MANRKVKPKVKTDTDYIENKLRISLDIPRSVSKRLAFNAVKSEIGKKITPELCKKLKKKLSDISDEQLAVEALNTWLEDINACDDDSPSMLYPTGYAGCVIGIARASFHNKQDVLLVSRLKVIEKLMKDDGLSEEEAVEFYDFNIAGAYMGEGTPIFVEMR